MEADEGSGLSNSTCYTTHQEVKSIGSNFKIKMVQSSECENFVCLFPFSVNNFSVMSGFCLFDSLPPINNLSVKQGRVFLG